MQEARNGIDGFGIDGFAADIATQRRYFAARVPSYERLLGLVADGLDGDIGRRLSKAWARRGFGVFYERPLLLLATLRLDALATGPDHPLWAALAADAPDASAVTGDALDRALARDRPRVWHSLTRRRVQTNEVSRAVAWLWPAALAAGRPLALCDMGCSAGLNLVADSLGLVWTEPPASPGAAPRPLPVARDPRVVVRHGFDLEPLDATDEEDSTWLRACVWAGERDRLGRLERALAAFREATRGGAPPVIETCDARDMPARVADLSGADRSGALWIAYQTVVREYLGPARQPYLDGMRAWLASRPPGRALWIELEDPPDGRTRERPTALIAHLCRPDGSPLDVVLARCQYHPVEIAPEADAVAAVRAALAA
ncbi:MAG TPA: DUF2332 family protein [Kofleriaceae bacterium]|nr:DUF2332 family protein [Kofleriaceae bacterium]